MFPTKILTYGSFDEAMVALKPTDLDFESNDMMLLSARVLN